MSDYRTNIGEPHPPTIKDRRRRVRITTIGIAAGLLLIAVAGWFIRVDRYALASGYVTREDYAEVRSPVVGIVAKIIVNSGQEVKEGDVLVQLDCSDEQTSLDEARSLVRQTEAEKTHLTSDIAERKRALQQDVAIAKLRLQNATTKRQRTQELVDRGLTAASALEDDKLREELSRVELQSYQDKDQTVFDKELEVVEQELAGRRDAVARAEGRLKARRVTAPITGQVLRYEFVVGELVKPDTVLYEIFGGDKQVLKLRVSERFATRVAPGQPYEAKLRPYRGIHRIIFKGNIEYLRDVIQAEGQQTYRVAYCSFDSRKHAVPPGTTAEAKIFYGRSSLWMFLLGID
jgi:multidrug resistance efflux pump